MLKIIHDWWFTKTCIAMATLVCAFHTAKLIWESAELRTNNLFRLNRFVKTYLNDINDCYIAEYSPDSDEMVVLG